MLEAPVLEVLVLEAPVLEATVLGAAGVVADGSAALVSSQNWSDTGVGSNREAGVLLRYPEIARYYSRIFESDWGTALKTIPKPKGGGTVTPEALAKGNFVQVSAADYQEV